MEYLYNGYSLQIPPGCFPFSTDSMILADFVSIKRNMSVLDLGSGCGQLGTLLCAKDSDCSVTGLEIDEKAHEAALMNISRNGLQHRMTSICADLRHISTQISPGSFPVCVSNPPYFSGGEASKTTPLARRDDACSISDLFRAAAWALKYGGDFFLVQKPERLAELCAAAVSNGLEPKKLLLIRHDPQASISMILLQCRKGGKPGLIWQEETLYDLHGEKTPFFRRVYHIS